MYIIKSWRLCSQNIVIGIDMGNIGNLENLLKIVFINEKCGNLGLDKSAS